MIGKTRRIPLIIIKTRRAEGIGRRQVARIAPLTPVSRGDVFDKKAGEPRSNL